MAEIDLDFDELASLMDDYKQPTTSRFERSMNEEELKKRIDSTRSKNSKKKANWAAKMFKEWLAERQRNEIVRGDHVFKAFEEMSKSELDSQLNYFIFEVRKKNGGRYPAKTLREIFQGLGYYLKDILGKGWRLFNDEEFESARMALDAAMKEANYHQVPCEGPGPSNPVSKNQEDGLWNKGILGDSDPQTLLRTIFFCCGKFFGLRGGREHRELKFGTQIQLTMTETGEALVYTNMHSKNYTGGLKQCRLKPKTIKVFTNQDNPERCFVRIYKLYASKRPSSGKVSAFYLKARTNFTDDSWFEDTVIGHNKLDTLMKEIASLGQLKGNYTNHSLKKTTGQFLKGMTEVQRKAHTGNRSQAQSIYEEVDDEDFQLTSSVLYGARPNASIDSTACMSNNSTNMNATRIVMNNETWQLQMPARKQMKMDVNAETNHISFHFF